MIVKQKYYCIHYEFRACIYIKNFKISLSNICKYY